MDFPLGHRGNSVYPLPAAFLLEGYVLGTFFAPRLAPSICFSCLEFLPLAFDYFCGWDICSMSLLATLISHRNVHN